MCVPDLNSILWCPPNFFSSPPPNSTPLEPRSPFTNWTGIVTISTEFFEFQKKTLEKISRKSQKDLHFLRVLSKSGYTNTQDNESKRK